MHLQVWVPWVIATGNLSSALLAGAGKVKGWVLMGITQLLFVIYALLTNQTGFIMQMGMCVIACINVYKWTTKGVHRKGSKELKDV